MQIVFLAYWHGVVNSKTYIHMTTKAINIKMNPLSLVHIYSSKVAKQQ